MTPTDMRVLPSAYARFRNVRLNKSHDLKRLMQWSDSLRADA